MPNKPVPPCEWDDETQDAVAADLAQIRLTRIVTSRFTGFRKEFGVPVRITVGAPKRWSVREQGLLEEIPEAAPRERIFWRRNPEATDEEMIPVYDERLDRNAVSIIAQLAELSRRYPGETLVLLCYEQFGGELSCHRWWLAGWFQQRFDIVIPELEL